MNIENRIKDLGIDLPAAAAPAAMYVPVKQTGNLLFVSGQIPVKDGQMVYTGKVGEERTLEEAQAAARLCAINIISAVKAHVGDLDKVVSIVKITAFVASKPGLISSTLWQMGHQNYYLMFFQRQEDIQDLLYQ